MTGQLTEVYMNLVRSAVMYNLETVALIQSHEGELMVFGVLLAAIKTDRIRNSSGLTVWSYIQTL